MPEPALLVPVEERIEHTQGNRLAHESVWQHRAHDHRLVFIVRVVSTGPPGPAAPLHLGSGGESEQDHRACNRGHHLEPRREDCYQRFIVESDR